MSAQILAAALIGASRTAMHLTLMAAVVIIAVVVVGVTRWRHKREAAEAAAAEQRPALHDSPEIGRPPEKK